MGRLARKEGWRKVNRLEEEPGRPGGRKGSTGVEVESTGDIEISLSQLETACDSQEKGTGISGVLIRKILFVGGFLLFLLKIASILREKGQLLTLEVKRRLERERALENRCPPDSWHIERQPLKRACGRRRKA